MTITIAGTWTLSLEAGFARTWDFDTDEDLEFTKPITATYIVEGGAEEGGDTPEKPEGTFGFISTPAAGSDVDSFDRFTITFPNYVPTGDYGYMSAKTGKISFIAGDKTYSVGLGRADQPENGWAVSFTIPNPEDRFETLTFTEKGVYTMHFDAGAFVAYDDDDNVVEQTEAFDVTFTIGGAEIPAANPFAEYTSTPADGAVLESFEELAISFPKWTPASADGDIRVQTGRITLTHGEKTYTASRKLLAGEKSSFLFEFRENGQAVTFTEGGEYTINFAEGAFKDMDYDDNLDDILLADSEPFAIKFTIKEAPNPLAYTATPESGATIAMPTDNLTITYTWPNAKEVLNEVYDFQKDPLYGTETVGMRVLYSTEMISRVDDATTDYGYSIATTEDGNQIVLTFNKEIFKTNGTIKIEADQGIFTVDGKPCDAINYTLTVGEAVDFDCVITPAAGEEVTELSTFTISFPTATTAKFVEGAWVVMFGPRQMSQYSCEPVAGADVPTFKITFDPAPYIAGRYTLTIDEGAFIINGKYASKAISHSVTLLRTTPIDTTCTPSPAGPKVQADEWGTYVAFVFAPDEEVYSILGWADKITVKFDDVLLKTPGDYNIAFQGDGETYKVLINIEAGDYVGKTGTLSVDIPEGCFYVETEPFKGISKTWQVVAPHDYGFVLTPADGDKTASLSTVTILFPEAETAELPNLNYIALRTQDYFGGYYQVATDAKPFTGEDGAGVIVTFDPAPTTDGVYVLSADYGAFFIDDFSLTKAFSATYTLDKDYSGVENITAAENGLYTVYSIDGKLLLENAEAPALRSLAPGFYIVNGKKMAIR